MAIGLIILFILGYACIALEHVIKFNKTAVALMLAVLSWFYYSAFIGWFSGKTAVQLSDHLASASEILFFLLGAMTIVELVDAHEGFRIVTDKIKTKNKRKLLWIIAGVTFFLSSILDNLTTSIVMVTVVRKLLDEEKEKIYYTGLIIIAANAGGAWSPIGDVTTTMLWIGGRITPGNIIAGVFVPAMVSMLIPLIFFTFKIKGSLPVSSVANKVTGPRSAGRVMFFSGISSLLLVPVLKSIFGLPPYMGMLFGLSCVWIISEIIHKDKDESEKHPFSASYALSKIDTPGILFFLGILLTVGALEEAGLLSSISLRLTAMLKNEDLIVTVLGLFSSIIDNVPLVAASMGMYDLHHYPVDHKLWEFLAYCTGTGGSILLIGSAAGVAVMGMEKITFGQYLKKISLWVLLGYLAGAFCYLAFYQIGKG